MSLVVEFQPCQVMKQTSMCYFPLTFLPWVVARAVPFEDHRLLTGDEELKGNWSPSHVVQWVKDLSAPLGRLCLGFKILSSLIILFIHWVPTCLLQDSSWGGEEGEKCKIKVFLLLYLVELYMESHGYHMMPSQHKNATPGGSAGWLRKSTIWDRKVGLPFWSCN